MDEGCRAVAEAKADNSHSMFPDRCRIFATPIRKQARNNWQVYTAPGRAWSITNDQVWMFDNEIDWVMRI
jgi:hypothetical protein